MAAVQYVPPPLDGAWEPECLTLLLYFHRQLYKDRLNLPMKAIIGYQSHDDTSSKSGSTTKNMYSVWTPIITVDLNRYKSTPSHKLFELSTTVVFLPFIERVLFILHKVGAFPVQWWIEELKLQERRFVWFDISNMSKRTFFFLFSFLDLEVLWVLTVTSHSLAKNKLCSRFEYLKKIIMRIKSCVFLLPSSHSLQKKKSSAPHRKRQVLKAF